MLWIKKYTDGVGNSAHYTESIATNSMYIATMVRRYTAAAETYYLYAFLNIAGDIINSLIIYSLHPRTYMN